ncbi:transmembrane protein, putative (macronuclear) [Tetrahymena thermophila SB210]|uniref:Transmembrane protein, putative n=1 Tax=Tetrahymena thermophila (strain SB210) TaxID=312017 RepID=W7XD85_TETTS|nr:transmembrane protein, putative [Tetrahymena thermophila SB210]EWS74588.1 transmembrane protein, putative [Tetrahymena thermophila SB210]|eukprot:XP_012652889.1 transmembrane protein, putative [Tetrahymena thermophila SB210]
MKKIKDNPIISSINQLSNCNIIPINVLQPFQLYFFSFYPISPICSLLFVFSPFISFHRYLILSIYIISILIKHLSCQVLLCVSVSFSNLIQLNNFKQYNKLIFICNYLNFFLFFTYLFYYSYLLQNDKNRKEFTFYQKIKMFIKISIEIIYLTKQKYQLVNQFFSQVRELMGDINYVNDVQKNLNIYKNENTLQIYLFVKLIHFIQ